MRNQLIVMCLLALSLVSFSGCSSINILESGSVQNENSIEVSKLMNNEEIIDNVSNIDSKNTENNNYKESSEITESYIEENADSAYELSTSEKNDSNIEESDDSFLNIIEQIEVNNGEVDMVQNGDINEGEGLVEALVSKDIFLYYTGISEADWEQYNIAEYIMENNITQSVFEKSYLNGSFNYLLTQTSIVLPKEYIDYIKRIVVYRKRELESETILIDMIQKKTFYSNLNYILNDVESAEIIRELTTEEIASIINIMKNSPIDKIDNFNKGNSTSNYQLIFSIECEQGVVRFDTSMLEAEDTELIINLSNSLLFLLYQEACLAE